MDYSRLEPHIICLPWVRYRLPKRGNGEGGTEVTVHTQRSTCRVEMVRYGFKRYSCVIVSKHRGDDGGGDGGGGVGQML